MLRINERPGYRTKAYEHPYSEAYPRAQTIYDEKPAQTKSYLSASELHDVTSMVIRFGTEFQFLTQIGEAEREDWPAVGYSIRIPGRFKRTLREILGQEGVHKDSIYPPLRETVRLFEHVVDESFKQ